MLHGFIPLRILLIQTYAYYLTDDYERVTLRLLSVPNGPEPLKYLVQYSHRKARKDELERRSISEIRGDVLYLEAEEAYGALSTLLGDNKFFFNEKCLHSLTPLMVDDQGCLT